MARRKIKTEAEKSIPEMADDVAREEMRQMYKDGKLTAYGRRMSKFLELALPDETVDEWGWNLSRKERAEIKRRAAEKKAAEEKKKAAARARAAYRRKQRPGARCRLKRCPPISRNRRGRNGRKSCARSSAASRGCDRVRRRCECGIISTETKV